MKCINLSGSHYEIGLQIGEYLEQERSTGFPPKFSKEDLEKSHAFEEQLRIYTPGLLDEFQGIADKMDIDYYIPLTLEATPYRFNTISCLVMAISGAHTASGFPILARNHEWKEEDSEYLRICYVQPKDKLRSVGFNFCWTLISRYGGINEAGLALSGASASFENKGPGIIVNMAIRWILDTCNTTEEAVKFLETMPKVWGETYVIIDKKNTIAKVEAHREKTKVMYTNSGFDFNSLLYDSEEMQQLLDQEKHIEFFKEPYTARKEFLHNWFAQKKGKITDAMIIDALKNHEHKMCDHSPNGPEICWSYLLKIMEKEALVCAGRPCKNEYKKIQTF